MKRLVCGIWIALMLTGCASAETFETVADDQSLQVMAPMGSLAVEIPEDAMVLAMNSQLQGRVYLCQDFVMTVQTLPAGNLDATISQLSGFRRKDVDLLSTRVGNMDRHEWVWCAVEEAGDMVCRAAVLDDGAYHYAVTVMASADVAGGLEQQWEEILASLRVDQ